MRMTERRVRLDWTEAREVPILAAAQRLGAALVDKRQQHCPFDDHPDQTPSFSLDTARNLYFCFGCGRGGSVIEFVAAYQGIGKADACRWLLGSFADTAVSPPKSRGASASTSPAAADPEVYVALLALSPLGGSGLAYLEKRCITAATAAHFRVGQIGDPAATLRVLTRQFGAARVAASGLVTPQGYIRFPRNALLFAHHKGGLPVFLQSRRLDIGNPRWMGLGGVSKIPFNLDAIERAREIYLVEGAMDVLSAYELGRTAIGLPGSSAPLTAEICGRLRSKTVYLLPDKDDAGARIAAQTRQTLLRSGVQVTIQNLGAEKDLNDYLINERGRHA